jgi:endonuclease YncB( thermonuclease family)
MIRLVNCARGRTTRAGAVVLMIAGAPASAAELPWTQAPVRVERNAPDAPMRERIPTDPGVAVRFSRPPLPDADGLLAGENRKVRLDRVQLPPREQLCGTQAGGRWSCGRRAATRLGALLAGRTALCSRAEDQDAAILTGDCRLGGRSVSEMLVEEGWAEPTDTADGGLTRILARAKAERRGIWGDGDR